jgi:hypothetical protein
MASLNINNAYLKPCPHCGNTDLQGPILAEYCGDSGEPVWWIECLKCLCGMEVAGENPDNLVKAWNLRT